jgi:hypothetical protein
LLKIKDLYDSNKLRSQVNPLGEAVVRIENGKPKKEANDDDARDRESRGDDRSLKLYRAPMKSPSATLKRRDQL